MKRQAMQEKIDGGGGGWGARVKGCKDQQELPGEVKF